MVFKPFNCGPSTAAANGLSLAVRFFGTSNAAWLNAFRLTGLADVYEFGLAGGARRVAGPTIYGTCRIHKFALYNSA